jgi:hypothetical protein
MATTKSTRAIMYLIFNLNLVCNISVAGFYARDRKNCCASVSQRFSVRYL